MKEDNSKKSDNTDIVEESLEKSMEKINCEVNNKQIDIHKKKNRGIYLDKIEKGISVILPATILINGVLEYVNSIMSERFYGIPNLYFNIDSKFGLLFRIFSIILITSIFFVPVILKELSEKIRFSITKTDCFYYALLIGFYAFVISAYLLIPIFQIINYVNSFSLIMSIVIPIFCAVIMGYITYRYLQLHIKDLKIIDVSDDKYTLESGYKYLIFDFNDGACLGEKKGQAKYKVPIGYRVSDVVKYVNKHKTIVDIKRNGKNLSYWSYEKNSDTGYIDIYIDDDFENKKILYAQYSNEKYKDENKIKSNCISGLLIFSSLIIIASITIRFNILKPEKKLAYEVIKEEKGINKIIICHYSDKVVLMDYKYSPSEKNTKDKSTKNETENIEIIRGKYTVETIDGKSIRLKKFNKVTVVEENNNDESDE